MQPHRLGSRLILAVNSQRRYCTQKMDSIIAAYKEVAKIADLEGARIEGVNGDNVMVQARWSGRNLATLERTTNAIHYTVQTAAGDITTSPPITSNPNVVLSKRSPSGRRLASVVTKEGDAEVQYVMVVEEDGSAFTVDTHALNKHGKVYSDPEFSCLDWSPCETKLVYVAEKKRVKPTNFFTPPPDKEGEDGRGTEYLHRDDWGEQLTGQSESVVVVVEVGSGQVEVHEVGEGWSAGQVCWAAAGLFGVAFCTTPYRLGLVYCPIRRSRLFHMDHHGNVTYLTDGSYHVRTPRPSPDGSRVAFLRCSAGGPHAKAMQLCVLAWPSKQDRVVVDVVARTHKIRGGYSFFGIYGYAGLPRRCWLDDSARIVMSSYKLSDVTTYVVDIESGEVTELTHLGSMTTLDVCGDWLLTAESTIASPPVLLLGKVPASGKEEELKNKFVRVTGPRSVPGMENHYRSHWTIVNPEPHPDPKYSDIPVPVLYLGPTSLGEGESKRPLICWPHGGPHSASLNTFMSEMAVFVRLGYSVVLVNYRGSLGAGQDGVDALPGHCGSVDVSDVHQAMLSCLKRFPAVLDDQQVFLCGGSHGGFLVTHLAAQYPDVYRAVSTRNPVTDIASMANVTDITDWTFVESGLPYDHGKVPDGDTLAKMHAMSPLSLVDSLKAPTLFLVGRNDRRVPPSQSINMHKMLLARGVHTKLLMYDDCHSLRKVKNDADWIINTALWFDQYRTK